MREENDPAKRYLPEDQARIFHHVVAQLLFMACRARRDIQTAVAFLTTRVKQPDEDDWMKLRRALKYLKGTIGLRLKLTVKDLGTILHYVDASYAVHPDCKGHTGYMMTLGEGAVCSTSGKQKINGGSSTEDELIGAHDKMPTVVWSKFFIEAQGHPVLRNILFQDNKSAILLETNGRLSSSKRTKHIKNRYFQMVDKIALGELEVAYKPTDEMWADINTKPRQGKGFREFRAKLMNCPVDYEDSTNYEDLDMKDGKTKPQCRVFAKVNGKRVVVRQ